MADIHLPTRATRRHCCGHAVYTTVGQMGPITLHRCWDCLHEWLVVLPPPKEPVRE